jgi:hypothetical protein
MLVIHTKVHYIIIYSIQNPISDPLARHTIKCWRNPCIIFKAKPAHLGGWGVTAAVMPEEDPWSMEVICTTARARALVERRPTPRSRRSPSPLVELCHTPKGDHGEI